MKSLSFVFAGTSDLSLKCLRILLECRPLRLKALVSRPDKLRGRGLKSQSSPVKAFAKQKGLPCWTPEKAGDPDFLKALAKENCDFSFVCAYGRILPAEYLSLFPKGSLNLHFSLLPKWRGAAPVQRALMAGDKKTGVSLQLMTEKLDAGHIVGQREFAVGADENAEDIFEKSLKEAEFLFQEELTKYLKGELKARPQSGWKSTYAPKIEKKEAEISWKESASHIHNKIRAFVSGPQAFSFLKGKRIKFSRSKIINERGGNILPGRVCLVDKDRLFIACGRGGALSLLEAQKEGKKKQHIEEFLRGNPVSLEDFFGK